MRLLTASSLLVLIILIGGTLLASQFILHSSIKIENPIRGSIKKGQRSLSTTSKYQQRMNIKPTSKLLDQTSRLNEGNFVTVHSNDPYFRTEEDEENGNQNRKHHLPDNWFPEKTQFITEASRRDRWSERALLQNYKPDRPDRACDLLASNITITRDESIVLGEVSVTRMPKWREKQLRKWKASKSNSSTVPSLSSSASPSTETCNYAFVLMVSNHKYVDGALVLAHTLWRTSSKVQQGEFCLVMLTSEKLHPDSIRQLSLVFDVVKAMRTLGTFVPKSYYAPTFDKAYLWSLTEYRYVMFLDADHYVTDATHLENLLVSGGGLANRIDPHDRRRRHRQHRHHLGEAKKVLVTNTNSSDGAKDDEEEYVLNDSDNVSGESWPANRIAAVGDHEYFQTGLMILKPSMDIFVDLYLEFRYGKFGYNQWRARDGILIRNCFLKSNDGISHPAGIFHFYGYFKPWFDFRKSRKITKEPIQFDGMYTKWWDAYEELHLSLFQYLPLSPNSYYGGGKKNRKQHLKEQSKRRFKCRESDEGDVGGNGGGRTINYGTINPACFLWLQRHRDAEEYLQPLSSVKARWWNLKVPSLKLYATTPSSGSPRPLSMLRESTVAANNKNANDSFESRTSCNAVCRRHKLVCRDDAFQWSSLSDCDAFRKMLQQGFYFNDSSFSISSDQRQQQQQGQPLLCKSCHLRVDGVNLPFINLQSQECFIHSFYAQKFQPRCDVGFSSERDVNSLVRICPCVSIAEQNISGVVVAGV